MATNNNFIHTERCGITAIGTATVRVAPDSATISAAISYWDTDAKLAFAGAKQRAETVQEFLKAQRIRGSSSMQVALAREFGVASKETRQGVNGFRAKIRFTIKVTDLDRIDELSAGLIEAGVEEISVGNFRSSLLQEMGNDARRQAVACARERAEIYCRETGLSVGKVLSIDEILLPPAPKMPGAPMPLMFPDRDPADLAITVTIAVLYEIARDTVE